MLATEPTKDGDLWIQIVRLRLRLQEGNWQVVRSERTLSPGIGRLRGPLTDDGVTFYMPCKPSYAGPVPARHPPFSFRRLR